MLKIAWSPLYVLPLPEGHKFPMLKYELIAEQLLYEGTISSSALFEPKMLDKADACLTHREDYWDRLISDGLSKQEIRKIGFPWSEALIRRERMIMQGTIDSALNALRFGVGMNIAGGTHHAYSFKGEGFCILNDNAIAANYLLAHRLAKRILIIDLDVHQGNGTAEIFHNNTSVFTFSVHASGNIFSQKERSDLDIELPGGVEDAHYLKLLKENLDAIFQTFEPDFVFYQSGVDVLGTDALGKLNLSRGGCKARDMQVLKMCEANRVPLAISMGGGYSKNIIDIVEAHCNTFRSVQEIFF